MQTLPHLRTRTTKRLAGMALPECWAGGAVLAEARILAKPVAKRTAADRRDLKREASKARVLETRP
jgi:hypothetical protein